MTGSSLLLLLDDITTLLDDIASISKIAGKKTAAVLGDDLAVNAQQLAGIAAARETPIVWAVAKGTFLNKLILVHSALLISAVIPTLIIPLLVCGALFLCFEGFETVWHFLHKKNQIIKSFKKNILDESPSPTTDKSTIDDFEKDKIKDAIRTDFILSAEIIVITLGVVSAQAFITQLGVLSIVAILVTVGVYGLVACIVKLDDLSLHLAQKTNASVQKIGRDLLALAPWLMRGLSVFGTLAMLMVAGGIITHDIAFFHHISQMLTDMLSNPLTSATSLILFDMFIGIIFGSLVLVIVTLYKSLNRAKVLNE
jgi:predicted DNA repair protein MutK